MLTVSTANSQDGKESKLVGALAVEWIVANCDYPASMKLAAIMADIVISESDPGKVKDERPRVHAAIKERFSETEAACRSAIKYISE